MACRPCQRTSQRLPDNTTCGWLCDEFPACLPPPSPELVGSLRELRQHQVREHENRLRTAQALIFLKQATTERVEEDGQRS